MIPSERSSHVVKECVRAVFGQFLSSSMASLISFFQRSLAKLLILVPVLVGLSISPMSVGALYPSDPSSVDVLDTSLRGQNLQNTEYVKYDLSGRDLSEANLSGSFFSVSNLQNANLSGANLQNVIAYATRFDNADLSEANFTGADLLKSFFNGAVIDGADFSDAVLDLDQQKALCQRASGKTFDSLQCSSVTESYVPSSEVENKFNPGVG